MSARLLLFLLVALLAVVLGFVTWTPHQAVWLVHRIGYPMMLLTVLLFGWQLARSLRGESRDLAARLRKRWAWAIFLGAATGFLHVHEEHAFKVVADEVLLSSTAMQMHFHREVSVVARAYDYAGNFNPLNVFLDKRPVVFPFLLTTLHDLTGYRVSNVFWLNGAVSAGLVGLVFLIGRRLGGRWAGAASVLWICSVPLVAQNATGGGFELLNLMMVALVTWLAMRLAERPGPERLSAMVLAGVLLAQVRYESALFVVPVGAMVAFHWWRRGQIELPAPVIAAPLLMLLIPWQQNVFKISTASWQLSGIAGATSPFGLQYFYDNVGHALNFLFSFDGTQANSWLLALLGIFACGFFVLLVYRDHRTLPRTDPQRTMVAIMIIGLLAHTAIMLCYFWGRWDDPVVRRLSLPAHLLFVFALLLVWPRLVGGAWQWRVLSAIAAAYVVLFTVPAMAMHRYTQEGLAARATNWLGGYARSYEGRNVLAIDVNAGLQWMLYRQASITPQRVAERWEDFAFHFRNRSFDEFLVVQRIGLDLSTGERIIAWDDDFGEALKLELIEEKAFAPLYLVRLSRIVGLDREKLQQWAEQRSKEVEVDESLRVQLPGPRDVDVLKEWVQRLP